MKTTEDQRPAHVLRVPATLRRSALTGVAGLAAAALLAACGGGSTVSTTAGTAGGPKTVAATAAGANGQGGGDDGGPGGGFRGADFAKIRDCLTAAGITLPTPTGRPGGGSFTRPPGDGGTDRPRFGITKGPDGKYTAPDGQVFTAPPTRGFGGPDGPGGGFRQIFADPKVQAALKACGLTVPTGRPDGQRPTATPTA